MRILHLAIACLLVTVSADAIARDDRGQYSITEALAQPSAKQSLAPDIGLYFGNQPHPKIVSRHGNWSTNKKTNAFGKSDLEACQWVFLSALLELQKRARSQGGNAVVNIKSNYKSVLTTSENEFTCGAGAIMAGVALTGDVVKLAR